MPAPETLLFIAAVFLVAGWVKGVVGMGLPTIAIGALGLAMPPVQAAALLVMPSLVTNAWQFAAGPAPARVARRLAPMLLFACAGTALGVHWLTQTHSVWPALTLGTVLAAYALAGLRLPRWVLPPAREPVLAPVVGALTGLLAGATGVFAVPAVPYLSALDLDRDELVQALGLSFAVSTLALAAALGFAGSFPQGLMWTSALAVGPALLGMALGRAVRHRLDPLRFRRWFFIAMGLVGLAIVVKALVRA